MANNNKAKGKALEVFASKSLEQATAASFVAAHPSALCFTPEGHIVFAGDVYTRQRTWSGTQEEYDALDVKDENTTYYVNAEAPEERRVYVGEQMMMGEPAEYNFTGLMYGLSSAAFTFYPDGLGGEGDAGSIIRPRSDGTFKASITGSISGLSSRYWRDSRGENWALIETVESVPNITGHVEGLCAGLVYLRSFKGLSSVTSSRAVNISGMFAGCDSLEEVDLSGIPMAGEMEFLFSGCASLRSYHSITLPRNGRGVSAQGMFQDSNVDYSKFPKNDSEMALFEGMTYAPYMFANCYHLGTVSTFALSSDFFRVTSAERMFQNNQFDALRNEAADYVCTLFSENGCVIDGLFYGCNRLKSVSDFRINAGSYYTGGFNEFASPFCGCSNLEYVVLQGLGYIGKFYDLTGAPKWGSTDDMKCVRETLINNIASPTVNGLSTNINVRLDAEVYGRLTEDDLAQITANNVTLTYK